MENFETKEARDRASRKNEQSLGAAGGNLGLARRGPEGGEDGAGKAWSRDNGQAFGKCLPRGPKPEQLQAGKAGTGDKETQPGASHVNR